VGRFSFAVLLTNRKVIVRQVFSIMTLPRLGKATWFILAFEAVRTNQAREFLGRVEA
jgi:hypothetical protein